MLTMYKTKQSLQIKVTITTVTPLESKLAKCRKLPDKTLAMSPKVRIIKAALA
jgi:hypothetical protein